MIWCRFEADGKISYGTVEGDRVTEVSGTPFGDYTATPNTRPLSQIKVLMPVIPPNFYAAGINYPEHVAFAAREAGTQPNIPTKADVGYRSANALIAHEEDIVMPRDSSGQFQYEGELVAVIGRKAKHLSEEEALDCVLGYTIGNDVSERAWQREDRTMWRAKNTDTFKPMGPWIVTGLDPTNLETTVRLNGEVVSQFNTGTMVFNTAHYISEITRYITLYPGDILWMGTEGATKNMAPGDVVEVEIDGIGTLRNRVVAEE